MNLQFRSQSIRSRPAKGSFKMRFDDPEVESAFRREHDRRSVMQVRIAGTLGLLLHLLFGQLVDRVLSTGHLIEDILRYGVAMPMVALPVICSFFPWFDRIRGWLIGLAILTSAITLNITYLLTDLPDDWVHSANMLLIGFNFLFVGLRFRTSLVVGVIQTIAMEITLLIAADLSLTYIIYANTFFLSVLVSNATGAYLLEKSQRYNFLQRSRLDDERALTEKLLLNVLPATIAHRLRSTPGIIADRYENVSVLFADLVGFTDQAGRIEPEDLVMLLDTIFSRFDEVVEENKLEKIKTIGDAYMAVAGVPIQRSDHASILVSSAQRMLEMVCHMHWPSGDPVQVRIGIASGPAVAGVIGRKKFAFDLWGDTVNLASRMESNGMPGVIQVAESTYQALKSDLPFEGPHMLTVKGKGVMRTWYLSGSTSRLHSAKLSDHADGQNWSIGI